MDHVASNGSDDEDASQSLKSAVPHSCVFQKSYSRYEFFIFMTCATTYFSMTSAQVHTGVVTDFTVEATSYNCSSNMICLGHARASLASDYNGSIGEGRLSLINQTHNSIGIAYYNQQVKLLDRSSNQAQYFSTNFTIDVRRGPGGERGDGMTFVMSESNLLHGRSGAAFGIFDDSRNDSTLTTPYKSVVVEFDTFFNTGYPIADLNDNHVSFDFVTITASAVADANALDAIYHVDLGDEQTKFAWVDYDRDTRRLEARVSYNNSRPEKPLVNLEVNLFDLVDESMWVGFSSASGKSLSNFYIGDWSFKSSSTRLHASGPSFSPPYTSNKPSGNKIGIIVGISVGFVMFLLVCVTVVTFLVRHRRSGGTSPLGCAVFPEEDPEIQLQGMPERFKYKQLSMATRGFSVDNKLGQGGFGSVYRGMLPSSGIPVAVKMINSDSNQGEKEFMAELSIISQLRHRNLIQLQGWCKDASRGKYLLVYELMSNRSLNKVLVQSPDKQTSCLSWAQRFNIITGTAAAVDYLHRGWKQQVIHRDIKSSNIMLDDEWNAKLGDFGLARLVDHEREASTTAVAGTYGYIAPEVLTSGKFTEKTDVYAFGAVVLEIACGRSAFSTTFPSEEIVLVDWVWQCQSEGDMLKTVDKRLVEYDSYWMEAVMNLGLLCSHPNPLARPSMRQIVQVLAGDAPVPSIPASKLAPSSSGPDITVIDPFHTP